VDVIPDWPASLTNAELLGLARTWRELAAQCNADKGGILRWGADGEKRD